MASDELLKSWQRTGAYLLDPRAHLSALVETDCAGEIAQFHHFLEHNELELALDELEAAFERSCVESWRVLELMALAAASMGLVDRQQRYDDRLTNSRGWKYQTVLEP
jgi:hypothetical protein